VIVVADASPLRYLILIEHVHVLPALYGRVIVPPAVITELNRGRTPDLVRAWLAKSPDWLHIQAPRKTLTGLRNMLGEGECQAIALAVETAADALLMDDRDARHEAEKMNCVVLGTLRVLADAGAHGHADLKTALDRLRLTNFRADDRLIQRILDESERA
jgi:predicted nucleic acid-binding protein